MWYSVVIDGKVQASCITREQAQTQISKWHEYFDTNPDACNIICSFTRPAIGEAVSTLDLGHWQKEIPTVSGTYHTACRDGVYAGAKEVVWDGGRLYMAGFPIWTSPEVDAWKGWWWSVPIEVPPKPPEW
jgi:hypothetical protein